MSLLSGYIGGGPIEPVEVAVGEDEGDRAVDEVDWRLGQLSSEQDMKYASAQ